MGSETGHTAGPRTTALFGRVGRGRATPPRAADEKRPAASLTGTFVRRGRPLPDKPVTPPSSEPTPEPPPAAGLPETDSRFPETPGDAPPPEARGDDLAENYILDSEPAFSWRAFGADLALFLMVFSAACAVMLLLALRAF